MTIDTSATAELEVGRAADARHGLLAVTAAPAAPGPAAVAVPAAAVLDTSPAFDRAAARYDVMVALNPGYHHHLRMAAKALVEQLPAAGPVRLLDLGCGSGASTRALLTRLGDRRAVGLTGIDASAGMLDRARAKRWPRGVRFAGGRAQQLADAPAEWGVAEPVDGVLAAYLFRNIPAGERDALVRSVFDVLTPGGTLVVQEYSVAGSQRAGLIWTAVCLGVVVPLSLVASGTSRIYRYLWRSVQDFDTVGDFTGRLTRAGFTDIRVRTVSGWQHGILHTVRATRPGGGSL